MVGTGLEDCSLDGTTYAIYCSLAMGSGEEVPVDTDALPLE